MSSIYYTISVPGVNMSDCIHSLKEAYNQLKVASRQHPGKMIEMWKHECINKTMDETTHNRDVGICCPKCGETATVHGYGNQTTCYYCPACGMEIPA